MYLLKTRKCFWPPLLHAPRPSTIPDFSVVQCGKLTQMVCLKAWGFWSPLESACVKGEKPEHKGRSFCHCGQVMTDKDECVILAFEIAAGGWVGLLWQYLIRVLERSIILNTLRQKWHIFGYERGKFMLPCWMPFWFVCREFLRSWGWRSSDTSLNACDSRPPSFFFSPLPSCPDWIFELPELTFHLLAQCCFGKGRSNL